MRLTAAQKQALVISFYRQADASGVPIVEVIETAALAQLETTKKGRVLVGTSAGGASVSYALPAVGDATQHDISTAIADMLMRANAIVEAHPEYSDEQIKAALVAAYPSVRVIRPDFSCAGLRG